MVRLGAVVVAVCVLGSPVAAQSTITPDTFVPSSNTRSAALIQSVVVVEPAAPVFGEPPSEVAALLDPTGATFSPRPVFAVRPESPDFVMPARQAPSPVPAPGAAGLLALAGLCARRRRER
ncbi:MAG: hypothetical protein KF699_06565 [Phycisphaeraceae bacterium]|nr:hypothetical protein [Phycisphaeraceae bacterium]MBX3407691.1 hypothetical protein [Phycisphaeraceae bacterium]